MNLSIYKIVLQDIPEIIGVVLITSNTFYFWIKKLSLKKHNKVGVIENEDFDNEEIEDGTVENDNAMEERDDYMETKDDQPLPETLETTMNNNYMLLLVLYGTLASSLTRSVLSLIDLADLGMF